MKRLLIGAALAALVLPSQALSHDDHACLDETCLTVSLFQSEAAPASRWEGVEAPRFGTWGFALDGRDETVRPGDNFFRYANGSAMDRMVIPSDRTSYGSFVRLAELSENRLKAIVDELSTRDGLAPGSDEAKIAAAYRSYMDEARLEALDAQPIAPYLAEIRAADSHEALAAYMGRTIGRAGGSVFSTGITIDQKHPDRYAVYISQSGLGLPNRDYYLLDRHAEHKARYRVYVQDMLTLIGWDDPSANADAILALEERIAGVHWTPIESRNRDRTYNEHTPARLIETAPGFDWAGYLAAARLGHVERLVVRQDTALPGIAAIFAETPAPILQAWQAFHTADQAAPHLSRRFSDRHWAFRQRDLLGQPEQRSRDKRAISFAESALGEALGRMYVERWFPAESKAMMEDLVANLRRALSVRLEDLSWMGPDTRAAAQEKLAKFTVKIGYPERWRDYAALDIRADDLFGNGERAGEFFWNDQVSRLDQPVDKAEWGMTPQTVNAYYNSANNEIVFPAAILQPPFFDPDADPAINYGGIGAVIGHEIGHGFDDQGSKSDGDGVLRDWWTAEDKARFESLTARLGAQYDQFEVEPGFNVQGGLSMGENIGDAAGVAVGLHAYQLSLEGRPAPVIDGLTGEQRFFLGWGQVWQSRYRPEALRRQVSVGPHSPPEFRVIGPLRNVDAWYDAFDVQPGDLYYLPPEQRVRIW